jgi:hypothetical protein
MALVIELSLNFHERRHYFCRQHLCNIYVIMWGKENFTKKKVGDRFVNKCLQLIANSFILFLFLFFSIQIYIAILLAAADCHFQELRLLARAKLESHFVRDGLMSFFLSFYYFTIYCTEICRKIVPRGYREKGGGLLIRNKKKDCVLSLFFHFFLLKLYIVDSAEAQEQLLNKEEEELINK